MIRSSLYVGVIALLASATTVACSSAATDRGGSGPSSSDSYSCPPGAKCPGPPLPSITVSLTIDGKTYSNSYGKVASTRRLAFAAGTRVPIALSLRTPSDNRISNVWLTINSYPSGVRYNHPTGKYRLLARHPGTLSPAQHLTATWTAARLFHTGRLDLTATFDIGNAGTSGVVANLQVTG
jgi:hypothetical protein